MADKMAERFAQRKKERETQGKPQTDFFVGVRQRGMLNQIMSQPAITFEAAHPEMRTKWEYAPLNGDNVMITQREAQGFRTVMNEEIGGKQPGAVRVGDMVLITAPREIMEQIEMEDALAAHEDAKLPEQTYKDNVQGLSVKLRDGTVQRGRPVGTIRKTEEVHDMTTSADEGGGEEG